MRLIPEISCILKEAATEVIPGKEMLLIFIIIEIVEKLKYTNGLQPVTSLKSGLRHRYLLFSFFLIIYFKEHLKEAAFEAVLIVSEIELALD